MPCALRPKRVGSLTNEFKTFVLLAPFDFKFYLQTFLSHTNTFRSVGAYCRKLKSMAVGSRGICLCAVFVNRGEMIKG
jgi:hypothetical protein